MSQAFTDWHRQMAASIAAAHPLTPTAPIRASGNSLAAENDEPEPDEAALLAADVQRNVNKAQRAHECNDAQALDAQLQAWRCNGGL